MARKVTRAARFVTDPIARGELYPHFKLTTEEFPRLLVTRKILDPNDEYFGAFLPNTSVRIWLYHLNLIFRLRSCDLPIDGSWPQPCAMYFSKKCLGPCVAALCSRDGYEEHVNALRLFLRDGIAALEPAIKEKLEGLSAQLEFEQAAHWRDILESARELATTKRMEIRLDRAIDTYSVLETKDDIVVYLMTTRGRRMVGNREFIFERKNGISTEAALTQILSGFYPFQLPREIRLPFELKIAAELHRRFKERFGRNVKFTVHHDRLNDAALNRLKRTQVDFALEKIGEDPTPAEIGKELKQVLGLKRTPKRIEAFDVAHLANRDFITASCVWENGEIQPDRMQFWTVAAENEPQAMALGVRERLLSPSSPDLLLIDGGVGQLNAVREILAEFGASEVNVVAAAKRPGDKRSIAYFLTVSGERVEFIAGRRAFELLRDLRDEAHQNANELHRQRRENLALRSSAIPLVITRLNEVGGAANDLRPIKGKLK
jgi:excinuclease ABC subunit C